MDNQDSVSLPQLSIREFKMWLRGVEEMQETDWTPNSVQWMRIRAKIECINEGTSDAKPIAHSPAVTYQHPSLPIAATHAPPVMRAPSQPLPSILTNQGGRVKTPDIDTSVGGYASGFA